MIRSLPSPGRELVLVVVVCAAGAALVLYAAARTWAVEVIARPAPLPDEQRELTGSALAPYLVPLGWAALAGALALLATRGRWRQAVGVLLSGLGLAAVAGGYWGSAQPDAGTHWPLLAVAGGLVVAGQGVAVVVRSRRWPAMGARYERGGRAARPEPDRPAGPGSQGKPARTEEMWQALDRGEDPTA